MRWLPSFVVLQPMGSPFERFVVRLLKVSVIYSSTLSGDRLDSFGDIDNRVEYLVAFDQANTVVD